MLVDIATEELKEFIYRPCHDQVERNLTIRETNG